MSAPGGLWPSHHHIELAPSGVIEHLVQAGPPIPSLGAADTGVVVFLDNLPAAALRYLAQFPNLIFDRLLVSRYADVNRGLFLHGGPQLRYPANKLLPYEKQLFYV